VPVQQSGDVTPGHLVTWATDNVIQDGGSVGVSERVLGYLNCNFNSTSDQAIALPDDINVFCLTRIIITNASTSLTTAAGGFYPQSAKGGTAIVSSAQAYSSLTTAAKLLNATLASYGSTTRFDASNVPDWAIYFSLTTGQGAAATADVYLVGLDLTVRS